MSASTDNNNNINKDDVPDMCANCGKGKESNNNLKACTACKMVKYCNRECQIAHRPQHKKACKKRAAELHHEELFKLPPSAYGDCPICFLRLPTLDTGRKYMSCCGKVICSGCAYAPVYDNEGNRIRERTCPFCRTQAPESEEQAIERMNKRVEVGDVKAIYNLGQFYAQGLHGMPQDHAKALELFHRATELGFAKAYHSIGYAYSFGQGVEMDKKRARYYWELAAMQGHTMSRYNLGIDGREAGNMDRALEHFIIAVRDGGSNSLESIKNMYKNGHVTKDDYTKALRTYQEYVDEVKSVQRDEAAAYSDRYKYY